MYTSSSPCQKNKLNSLQEQGVSAASKKREGKKLSRFFFFLQDFAVGAPGNRPRRGPPSPPLRVPDRQGHARLVFSPSGVRLRLAGAPPGPGEAVPALARLERGLEVRRGADGVGRRRGSSRGGRQIGEERRRVAAQPASAPLSSCAGGSSSSSERARCTARRRGRGG